MIKVIGRELQIPQSERKLGFESDNLVETRTFYITDKALFDLSFKLDVAEYGCTVDLDKSVMPDGSGIILTWTVTSGIMQNSGRINVQLRAFDTESSLVWHSEMQTFFVGESVNALKEIENVPLSEFEQVEVKATAAKEEAAIQAELAKEYAQESISAANSANTKLDEHKADNGNPHGVTAEQVGAYTKEEIEEKLAEVAEAEHVHACAIPTPKSGDSNGGMNAGALFETGKDGFMSADDKRKLDGIEAGANKTVVDAVLSNESENPVSNKAVAEEFEYINEVLSKKANVLDYGAHVADKANPHGVTAEQIGAYTKVEVDNEIFRVNDSLGMHLISDYNPHNVTASQVGAYTKSEVDTKINEKTGTISMVIGVHGADKDNPHGVTASQVGAYTKVEVDEKLGDIGSALDELHAYAQGLISGGDA